MSTADIHITLTKPHADLQPDMSLFAQLIIDGNQVLQTIPAKRDELQDSWNLIFECNVPLRVLTFAIAIMRQSRYRGIRLLGFVEIQREDVLISTGESGLRRQLEKVNLDGASLDFLARFSLSETSTTTTEAFNSFDVTDGAKIQIRNLDGEIITALLHKMFEADCRMDALDFWLMHEKILLTDANEHRAKSLNFLGNISAHCSRTTQTIKNLNQAICAYSDAVRDDPTNLTYRFNFGNALTERFDRVGDLADVDEAVVVCREAVRLSPDGQPPQELALLALGLSLHRRFLRLSILSDIDESIALLRKGVTLLPDGHRAKGFLLSALGDSLRCRFERLGDLGDINTSISLLSEAVAPLPDGHPAKALWLGKFGFSLLRRFDRLGDLGDLDHSLLVLRTSVRLSPSGEEKTFSLGMLGNCLRIRFERFKSVDDLNESVRMLKEATALCPDMHPDKSNFLNILGRVLMHRFDQLDKLDDLRESVLSFQKALRLLPLGHPDRGHTLGNLGEALTARYKRLGDVHDLNGAVALGKHAVGLYPDGHPAKPMVLRNLCLALFRRFLDETQIGPNPDDYEQLVSHLASAASSRTGPANARFQAAVAWGSFPLGGDLVRQFSSGHLTYPAPKPRQPWVEAIFAARPERWTESLRAYTVALDLLPEVA
ncbi:hypothetical protein B0H11DRAFT_2270663 [Mycena galericulata]|nr:hypothetical protein B0H11DRAFT_2270663 [Mycena galericulata]